MINPAFALFIGQRLAQLRAAIPSVPCPRPPVRVRPTFRLFAGDLNETSAGVTITPNGARTSFGIGWGWDDDCPVRARVRLAHEMTDLDSGATTDGWHLSFAGFYLCQRWLVRPAGPVLG